MKAQNKVNGAPKMRHRNETVWSWLFMLPTMIFLGVTALLPLLYSVYLSFFKYKINLPNAVPTFNGLGNYIKMFTDKTLAVSTGNTVLFAVISVVLELVIIKPNLIDLIIRMCMRVIIYKLDLIVLI